MFVAGNAARRDARPGNCVANQRRIIMDHLPSFDLDPFNQAAYEPVIKAMAARPNIFVKLTAVYHPRLDTKQVVDEYAPLRDRLSICTACSAKTA